VGAGGWLAVAAACAEPLVAGARAAMRRWRVDVAACVAVAWAGLQLRHPHVSLGLLSNMLPVYYQFLDDFGAFQQVRCV
jgi:hypothetical protein